ncbi:enoyl-CoA hydratase/isomerase family protein [Actinocorallia sp. A-T 12471]|uniref:enoyl-CoA hydratase/isomerase family protein n=1 Tax=Actinocorallia sp. A-T 12471 TaxID=3089813 RepID=UPI0029D05415|nr:enoyl-CoA hydratase/isomerase family protein [Actinocorallia sp. A-T 12471]MDX6740980.1 enoyl-CoA hydratase/isomerase family protein [Actinocorallia sp. A-T 12471]
MKNTPASPEGARDAGLRVERAGPVGWLVFDRPHRGNAMDAAMMARLPEAWAELDADPAVRVICVTGEGSAFQTGLDVAQLAKDPGALREMSRRTKRADLRLTAWHLGVAKPVVTAVNGVCAGGGLHFVADSDVVIASTRASFLDPHVSVGQVSAFETIGLARRASFTPVARMALTGAHERIGAADALRLGWVSEVVAPEELRPAAQALAERIAEHPPEVLAAVKRALWRGLETGLSEARGVPR